MTLVKLTALTLISHATAGLSGSSLESRKTCSLTETNAYRYGCALSGWAQFPSTLKTLRKVSQLEDCAQACYSNIACKSFRYVSKFQKCYLYKKYLDAMEFTGSNFEPGVFYERECYSTDCDVIDACKKDNACQALNAYLYPFIYDYSNFGCGFGVTAKLKRFPSTESLLNSKTACDAINECASNGNRGSFVVSYYKPSKAWICELYDNAPGYNYLNLHDQRIHLMTLTAKNDSIGASFGYWLYNYYYID